MKKDGIQTRKRKPKSSNSNHLSSNLAGSSGMALQRSLGKYIDWIDAGEIYLHPSTQLITKLC